MNNLRIPLVILILSSALAFAAPIEIGMTEAKLLQSRGQPTNKMTVGNKAIYQWNDLSVTLNNGLVESFKFVSPRTSMTPQKKPDRSPTKETKPAPSFSFEHLIPQVDPAEKRLHEAIAKKNRVVALENEIKFMEAQLTEAAKRISIGKSSSGMSAEEEQLLRLRLEKAQNELARLK